METTKLFVYGAGGHGKVVADIAECCGFEVAGFIDDDPARGDLSFAEYCADHSGTPVALGLGGNRARAKIYGQLKQAKAPIPALIHPESVIARSARIGEGAVVMAGAVINPDALIERGAIINTACVIEHDNVIGEFAHISPKAALAGDVCVDSRSACPAESTVNRDKLLAP